MVNLGRPQAEPLDLPILMDAAEYYVQEEADREGEDEPNTRRVSEHFFDDGHRDSRLRRAAVGLSWYIPKIPPELVFLAGWTSKWAIKMLLLAKFLLVHNAVVFVARR